MNVISGLDLVMDPKSRSIPSFRGVYPNISLDVNVVVKDRISIWLCCYVMGMVCDVFYFKNKERTKSFFISHPKTRERSVFQPIPLILDLSV